jgi:Pyruvate/2-oxoacid:ferredoxin oxidoreductase delta subunit
MRAIFREDSKEKPWVDFYRCSGCLRCKVVCQNKAIEEIAHPCDDKGKIGW